MQAVLVTGFNNWGKTTHIQTLFNRGRFYSTPYPTVHAAITTRFLVEPRSNDDLGEDRFVASVEKRYQKSPKKRADLVAALCPSRETRNDCVRILNSKTFRRFDRIHVLLLQYKWDWHAELRLDEVRAYLSADPRVSFVVINADATQRTDSAKLVARDAQIGSELGKLFP